MNYNKEYLLLKAEICFSENKVEEAYQLLKNLFKIDKNYRGAYGFMGKVLFTLNRFEESKIYLDKAIHNNPKDFESITILGKIKFKQKKYSEAKELFISSMKINQFFDENYYYLGLAEEIAGNEREAQKFFVKCFDYSNGINHEALKKIINKKDCLLIIENTMTISEGFVSDKVWTNLGYILFGRFNFFKEFLNIINTSSLSEISKSLFLKKLNLKEENFKKFLDYFFQFYDFSDEITPKLNKLLNSELS